MNAHMFILKGKSDFWLFPLKMNTCVFLCIIAQSRLSDDFVNVNYSSRKICFSSMNRFTTIQYWGDYPIPWTSVSLFTTLFLNISFVWCRTELPYKVGICFLFDTIPIYGGCILFSKLTDACCSFLYYSDKEQIN